MIATDQVLIDPPAEQVRRELLTAGMSVQYSLPPGSDDLRLTAADEDALLEGLRDTAEGHVEWRVPAQGWRYGVQAALVAVWWSDFLGRKHVRLVGGSPQGGAVLPVPAPDLPALACVYPDRCVFASLHRRSRLLVVCPCGACGTPAELAWMGPTCGPCFDRGPGEEVRGVSVLHGAEGVAALAFSPDGKRLATWDGKIVCVHDLEQGTAIAALEERESCSRLAFGAGGTLLAWGSEAERWTAVCAWGAGKSRRRPGFPFAFPCQGGIVLHGPDGTTFESSSDRRTIHPPFALTPSDLAVSPDGRLLAGACGGQGLMLWDFASGLPIQCVQLGPVAAPLAFSPDGALLAVAVRGLSGWGGVALWEVRAGRLRARVSVRPSLRGLAFTADGSALVTDEADDCLRVWDVHSGLERRALHLPPGTRLLSMALSPDGRLLALGLAAGGVRLWPAELLRGE
jgi:hypothetical protein